MNTEQDVSLMCVHDTREDAIMEPQLTNWLPVDLFGSCIKMEAFIFLE